MVVWAAASAMPGTQAHSAPPATTHVRAEQAILEYVRQMGVLRPKMVSVAGRVLGDQEFAHDVVQSAFYQAYRSLDRFRGDAQFSTWLTRIVINEAIRQGKKRTTRWGREVGVEDLNLVPTPITDRSTIAHEFTRIQNEVARLVRGAVRHLPAVYRQVVELRYYEEFAYHEIADVLGISLGTVKSRLGRAHDRLWKVFTRSPYAEYFQMWLPLIMPYVGQIPTGLSAKAERPRLRSRL